MNPVEPYTALPLQFPCRSVNDASSVEEGRRWMMEAIAECERCIRGSAAFIQMYSGPGVGLVVLPEYFLSSYPAGESIGEWQEKGCIRAGGPELESLGGVAERCGVFLSGNAYEIDEYFPELYFQTSFIIGSSGDLILSYRRLISMFAPTPHDVLDAYLDRYGIEGLFPVVDTSLGRLACVASEEILYPEISRAMALRGAEVICHSSSEAGSLKTTPKNIAKRARALENLVYVVSANSAGISGIALPEHSTDGHSQVVDYRGNVLAEAGFGESLNGHAEVDITALRRTRKRPAMGNLLARQRLELFAPIYGGEPVHPANQLLEQGSVRTPERGWFAETQQQVIDDLAKRGVI